MPATASSRSKTHTASWMAFDDHRIPQPRPCKCSAPCRLVCPALAGLRQPLAPVSGVHAVDTFSVTEPVTLIHWYVQCGSCPGRRSLLPHRSSARWSQPNADDLVGPGSGTVRVFETGSDASGAVVTTSLYQHLPPSPDPHRGQRPGESRKLLAFSDSLCWTRRAGC